MSAAFVFSSYAGNHIFISNTPRINKNYMADLQKQFRKNVNNVYLAFSFFNKKPVRKDVAIILPTLRSLPIAINKTNTNTIAPISPTVIPTVNSKQGIVAKINVLSIPENLFKSISKGVSAYEAGDNKIILKLDNGATLKTKKFTLPDGRTFEAIDFSGQ